RGTGTSLKRDLRIPTRCNPDTCPQVSEVRHPPQWNGQHQRQRFSCCSVSHLRICYVYEE
ncbi:MAG: hypothetical protein ACRDHZ_06090, partial [Ktedonobacteraceae bacterium]